MIVQRAVLDLGEAAHVGLGLVARILGIRLRMMRVMAVIVMRRMGVGVIGMGIVRMVVMAMGMRGVLDML